MDLRLHAAPPSSLLDEGCSLSALARAAVSSGVRSRALRNFGERRRGRVDGRRLARVRMSLGRRGVGGLGLWGLEELLGVNSRARTGVEV